MSRDIFLLKMGPRWTTGPIYDNVQAFIISSRVCSFVNVIYCMPILTCIAVAYMMHLGLSVIFLSELSHIYGVNYADNARLYNST